jgi:catechol 2,3-dioxygenase
MTILPSAVPTAARAALGDATRLGAVHLTVTDLERSLAFYEDAIGLRVHRREGAAAALGAGDADLVVLREDPTARPAGRHGGLYHVALLYPTRAELAHVAIRLASTRVPIQGASNHGTHEAIYLPDPDGNGLELAADFPREQWPDISSPEGYGAGPAPLDLDDLLATIAGEAPVADAGAGLRMGHVHLHVGDLDAARAFYADRLGLELMTTYPGALFLAAGGYHHHLGANTWAGEGVGPAPPGTARLLEWTMLFDDAAELDAVRERMGGEVAADPWGIRLRFDVAPVN